MQEMWENVFLIYIKNTAVSIFFFNLSKYIFVLITSTGKGDLHNIPI